FLESGSAGASGGPSGAGALGAASGFRARRAVARRRGFASASGGPPAPGASGVGVSSGDGRSCSSAMNGIAGEYGGRPARAVRRWSRGIGVPAPPARRRWTRRREALGRAGRGARSPAGVGRRSRERAGAASGRCVGALARNSGGGVGRATPELVQQSGRRAVRLPLLRLLRVQRRRSVWLRATSRARAEGRPAEGATRPQCRPSRRASHSVTRPAI